MYLHSVFLSFIFLAVAPLFGEAWLPSNLYMRRTARQTGQGTCEQYQGHVCERVLGNRTIFVASGTTQVAKEGILIHDFTLLASSMIIRPNCRPYLIAIVCHFTFPPCEENDDSIVVHQPCRDECSRLESGRCSQEFAFGRSNSEILTGQTAPTCSALPQSGCASVGVPTEMQQQ